MDCAAAGFSEVDEDRSDADDDGDGVDDDVDRMQRSTQLICLLLPYKL